MSPKSIPKYSSRYLRQSVFPYAVYVASLKSSNFL